MILEVLDRITADTDGYDSYNINHSFDGFQKWIAFEKKNALGKIVQSLTNMFVKCSMFGYKNLFLILFFLFFSIFNIFQKRRLRSKLIIGIDVS